MSCQKKNFSDGVVLIVIKSFLTCCSQKSGKFNLCSADFNLLSRFSRYQHQNGSFALLANIGQKSEKSAI